MLHISSCLWIITASESGKDPALENFKGTWIAHFYNDETTTFGIYIRSFYWTIQTISTVGYGDTLPASIVEMMFCCFIMLVGQIAFGYAVSTATSIMTNYDLNSEKYNQQTEILEKAKERYDICISLYRDIKGVIDYKEQKNLFEEHDTFAELVVFLEHLPFHLRKELAKAVFEERYNF